ncbi:MAG: response regulator, partial [Deltaproteobacteria bacterium]|nr:response regulator [Deltaproteobacteria bacterium]
EGNEEMNKTILIVDDEKDLCTILSDSLSRDRYRVVPAFNGKTALQLVKKEKPDLILLDIKMPGMDGIEVLRKIKRMKKEIVVIMFTAYGTLETARKAMKLGAYDYVTKPVDLFLLKSLVKEVLGKASKSVTKGKR